MIQFEKNIKGKLLVFCTWNAVKWNVIVKTQFLCTIIEKHDLRFWNWIYSKKIDDIYVFVIVDASNLWRYFKHTQRNHLTETIESM